MAMTTKQFLLEAIEQLPEQHLLDVLEYVQSLSHRLKSSPTDESSQAADPLTDFIGAVSYGSLAANIDRDLYGC